MRKGTRRVVSMTAMKVVQRRAVAKRMRMLTAKAATMTRNECCVASPTNVVQYNYFCKHVCCNILKYYWIPSL